MPASADAAREILLARSILAAELEARAALEGVQELQGMLQAPRKGSERTRAGAVERLGQAIEAARVLGRTNADTARLAGVAHLALKRAEALQWELAMTERRVATVEARKLGTRFLELPDLVQEGFLGLLDAARRFDPDRGLRFSTYARWWVRARMTRAIDNTGRLVRLPGNAVEQLRNLKKAEQGGATGADSLAEWAGIDVERMKVLQASGPSVSLDQRFDDEGRTLGDSLPDDDAVDPSEWSAHSQAALRVRQAMRDVLDERERRVLTERYGVHGDQDLSLSEIARRMRLSRERVRQIERRALKGLAQHLGAMA